MTDASSPPSASPRALGPFVVFGVAALIAAIAAVVELSYYAGNSALAPSALGTTLGIVIAVGAFFVWGLRAPPND
jgi:hypothetical protein